MSGLNEFEICDIGIGATVLAHNRTCEWCIVANGTLDNIVSLAKMHLDGCELRGINEAREEGRL